jgi:hypothetical protein
VLGVREVVLVTEDVVTEHPAARELLRALLVVERDVIEATVQLLDERTFSGAGWAFYNDEDVVPSGLCVV